MVKRGVLALTIMFSVVIHSKWSGLFNGNWARWGKADVVERLHLVSSRESAVIRIVESVSFQH